VRRSLAARPRCKRILVEMVMINEKDETACVWAGEWALGDGAAEHG